MKINVVRDLSIDRPRNAVFAGRVLDKLPPQLIGYGFTIFRLGLSNDQWAIISKLINSRH